MHFKLDFAHPFVIYWLVQNGANKNQHHEAHQRKTKHDKFVFFANKSIGWAKYVYVCKWEMCERNFCVFSLVTIQCEK